MTRLSGKTIWITGASSGIGEALTRHLANTDNRLIISARREAELERVRDECRSGAITILPLDLADGHSLPARCEQAMGIHNGVDVLINNGGISQRSFVRDTEMDVYRRIVEVNFFGNIALTRGLLPYMRKKGGHIAVVSSLVGKFGTPYRSGYSASKHALHGFYDSLRAEEHANGIRVTLICPGFVRTNITRVSLTGEGDLYNKMDSAIANGMDPEYVASRILSAIEKDREEVILGGKEKLGVYLKRFFPLLFSKYIRKANVK